MDNKVETYDECVFIAMLNSLHRLEQRHDGLHAAMNSTRNETMKTGENIQKMIGKGFLALAEVASGNKEVLKSAEKILIEDK